MAMNYEKLPTRVAEKLIPPNESPEVTKRKFETMLDLLEDRLNDIDVSERPTVIDFQGLPPGSKEEDYLKWIQREVNIEPEIILGENPEDSGPEYRRLNYAYQKGKDFLRKTLKYGDKDLDIGPDSLSNKNDIFNLLGKTVLAKGKAQGLSRAPLYCRLVKATVAAYENVRHDAELLKEITADFENSLVAPVYKSTSEATPFVQLKENGRGKEFYANADGSIKGKINSRGKDIDKAMLRFLTRAESTAKSSLKDGIASRITVEKGDAEKILPILCEWLGEKMKVDFIRITNQNFFTKEELKKLEKDLHSSPKVNLDFSINESELDKTSMGGFKTIKILGRLKSDKESGDRAVHARQFEIQIVTPDNKNEIGRTHHSVYDVVKLVTARTRLDGGCPEHVFKEFIKDASAESGMSEKTLMSFLLEGPDAPIVKTQRKNPRGGRKGEAFYIAESVYDRWNNFGWVDQSLVKEIKKARKPSSKEDELIFRPKGPI